MPQNARNTAAASTFQFFSFFFISNPAIQFFRHFNAAFPTVRCYISHLPDQQFVTEFNQITASIILTLQTFLQLKYQSITDQKDSPFLTHPIVMNVAVYSSAAHFFAYGAVIRFPLHRLAFLAHHLLVSSGYIAVAALSSVVLPDAAAPFVYAVFGLLSAAELLIWLHRKLAEEEDEEAELWIRIWRILRFFNNLNHNFYGERTMPRLQV